jgi:hypothetical protein
VVIAATGRQFFACKNSRFYRHLTSAGKIPILAVSIRRGFVRRVIREQIWAAIIAGRPGS